MTGKEAASFGVDQSAKNEHSHSPDSYRDKSFCNAEIPQKIPWITRRFRLDLTLVSAIAWGIFVMEKFPYLKP